MSQKRTKNIPQPRLQILALLLLLILPTWARTTSVVDPPLSVSFSRPNGFHPGPIELQLRAPGSSRIYYTLDGSTPSRRANLYEEPIVISTSTAVRAIAFRDGEKGPLQAATYLIGEPETSLPVVTISIDPQLLFDPRQGIFVAGQGKSHANANYWTRQEYLANVEIFENDGNCVYQALSGFRLFGGQSRFFPQKSIALVARDDYQQKRIDYPIFGDGGLKKFKFLVLRNSGSDWGRSHFRDAAITTIAQDMNVDCQDYRPAHVYLNGRYWGIYNIREKLNKYFIAAHHDVDKDSIDFLEHKFTVRDGSRYQYQKLLEFLKENDLANPTHYTYVCSQIDVTSFIDHQIAQIYFDNRDAGGNIRFWRPRTGRGRWRWILYDTDWGMGLYDKDAASFNSLAFHTEANGPRWPNPPWSTFLLRKLLENDLFRRQFATRFADHLNTTLSPGNVLQVIDQIYFNLLPEMPRHLDRWRLSERAWHNEVLRIKNFASDRADYMWRYLQDHFQTGIMRPIVLESTSGGRIVINDHIDVRRERLYTQYFENLPVHLAAVPDYGYRFSHWEGTFSGDKQSTLVLSQDQSAIDLRAVFEPYDHPMASKLVINEISPNDPRSEDWLELYNNSDQRIYLKGWKIVDLKNEFAFPDWHIDPNDYLIVAEDREAFWKAFPRAYNVAGDLDFGISKRHEVIQLFAPDGAAVDSVSYTLPYTDSTFTLSLQLPWLDNADTSNWVQRYGPGTPNGANPYYVDSRVRRNQARWIQAGASFGVLILGLLMLRLRYRGYF